MEYNPLIHYPVYDACTVDVFEASQHLVHEELHMIVCQLLSLDNVVEVGSHQRSDQITETNDHRY